METSEIPKHSKNNFLDIDVDLLYQLNVIIRPTCIARNVELMNLFL